MTDILDIGRYERRYDLKRSIVGLKRMEYPEVDIDMPGLIMHGSEADPYTILKYGLAPRQTDKNSMETEWQICLGLNSKNRNTTIKSNLSRKNAAVKYAGNFSEDGIVYIISEEVKKTPGYKEFWDKGEEARGYAWVNRAIVAKMIKGLITENLPLAAAVIYATQMDIPIYKPDGTSYRVVPVD